jgi:hypothetical protein
MGPFTLSGSASSGANGTMSDSLEGSVEPPDAGRNVALVILPHAMVELSGTAVTQRSAAAIARALRPL